ncbi:hypothetical protein FVB32_16440 [Flagellimonas hymeniacidonis]|uniref:Uncharacterized protein n=1 Tax=Flagellimonas hymeniacidonis TaxID=2603628 RepID=A0A5C8V527_9FLAO|nr:hypothetical protein [Flagellimonas hymeniacidonis]TXN36145.1 hypothetical protein FVB32_16440 [Flagellimonas hymeniacidonis]
MLDIVRTYFTKGNAFYGLEVYQIGNNIKFHLLEVVKKKGELVITNSQSFEELQLLVDFAKPSVPICLIYNTDSVITKQTGAEPNFEDKGAVEQLFPGLNFENFFYQISNLGDLSYISVVKKQDVETYLVRLKEMKFKIGGLSLGASSLSRIANYLNNDFILTNRGKVVLNNISDTNLSASTEKSSSSSYDINGLNVKHTEILAFSEILDFLTRNVKDTSNFVDVVENLQNEFANSRTFGILLHSSLVFILLLLLSNFFLFNFYFDGVQLSKENLAFENENKKNLMALTDKVAEKERKVDAVLSVSNSRTSYYLDELGASIPKSILLDGLQYQPLTKPVQSLKPIELNIDELLVMGNCINSEDFSSWLIHLEGLEWVQSVETMDYDYKNKNTSNFKIKISATTP